jgi:hypothetical protein
MNTAALVPAAFLEVRAREEGGNHNQLPRPGRGIP